MTGPDACIAGVGTALPGEPVGNGTLARRFGVNEEWIDAFIGTRTRHFALDLATGRRTHSLTDLCEQAAEQALAAAGTRPEEVDFVVLGTATPDHLIPTTANLLAGRLGIDGVPTYQLQSGCAGAVQAFDVAARFLAGEDFETCLVLGGDVCAKHLDVERDYSALPPEELINLTLFGDGAGAAVVTRRPRAERTLIRRVLNRVSGTDRAPGQIIEWFGVADRDSGARAAAEDYKAIEEHVPGMTAETVWELAEDAGWPLDTIDFLLPPQLSGRMTERIVKELSLPIAGEVSCVTETGNNGNALPFHQLERLLKEMRPGQRALCVAIESSQWIRTGLAVEKVPPC